MKFDDKELIKILEIASNESKSYKIADTLLSLRLTEDLKETVGIKQP